MAMRSDAGAGNAAELLVVDVALPRDVAPECGDIDGLELFDLDRVGSFVARGLESRSGELDAARSIVDQEVIKHAERVGQLSVTPLITDFRARAEQLRSDELERQSRRLADLDPEQRQLVDEITRAVVNKMLHDPTVRLKESATSLRGERLAAALRELYQLD